MSSEPSSPGFIDPNARLLASVIPPPPPTMRTRALRFITTRRSGALRSIVRWSRSREGRSCFIAALAGVGLTFAFYRSESSSAASAGSAVPGAERPSAALAASPSVRSQPLALTPAVTAARTPESERDDTVPTQASAGAEHDPAGDAADEPVLAAALGDTSRAIDERHPSSRKPSVAKSKSKGKTKKFAKGRKAKRQSLAKSSSRASRRAKSQRVTAAGPLAAWLATQRSKDVSVGKRR